MTHSHRIVTALALVLALSIPATTMAGGLDAFLKELDVKASADLGAFKADLSISFGVPEQKVSGLFELMANPGDVYMTLRIGEVANQPIDRVVAEHQKSNGQGWGAIAKNLGIKPGSAEFHALKEGRLASHGSGKSNGNSNGKKSKGKS